MGISGFQLFPVYNDKVVAFLLLSELISPEAA
jgi:hypothetical protein